jgi:hypothetical protein
LAKEFCTESYSTIFQRTIIEIRRPSFILQKQYWLGLGSWSMKTVLKVSAVVIVIMLSIASSLSLGRRGLWGGRVANLTRHFASQSKIATKETVANHPAYDKMEDFTLPEYGMSGSIYAHRKSGAQVISVLAPDDNKVFGITFRTPPQDSTGVPHILEHSVLCGSRKFPVKEPFLDLLKGSLQNFLNAMTYPDRTCYPIASTNTKDYYNLMHVYLDAVLHPRAFHDPLVLQQEGWHYELDDKNQPLTIKGVVYNEMKGVYSSPDALMGRAAQQALFPHNTYGVDSGGDPNRIPDLTFKEFQDFHKTHYHPSNARVFFYGNDDPAQRLTVLDEYLREFDRVPVTSQVQYQRKLSLKGKPKVTVPFPISAGTEPKHMITVNWLLNEAPLSTRDALAMEVLDYLLLGTSTSALRKALVESNLGESVTGGGLSDELLQSSFAVGLKGVKADKTEEVRHLIAQKLQELATTGFEHGAVEAAINTLEFRLREFNTGSYPKGLLIMLSMMKKWIYDQNPVDAITFEEPLRDLKADIASEKPVFQELLQRFFLRNEHEVVVEMIPDATLEDKETAAEVQRLENIKAQLSNDKLDEIIAATKTLREAQERPDTPEARATLPRLTLDDIDAKAKDIACVIDKKPEYTVLTHPLQTNGILYVDMVLDYSAVDMEDVEYLPLFARMLMESGTENYDATALSRRIGAHTGGISVSFQNDYRGKMTEVAQPDEAQLYLLLRGKAVDAKLPILFDLFEEILLRAKLSNQKRAVEMLRESKNRKEASVLSSGHSYASTRLSAKGGSLLSYMGELTGGLTSVRRAGQLLQEAEENWPAVQAKLERIRSRIAVRPYSPAATATMRSEGNVGHGAEEQFIVNLTGDETLLKSAAPLVEQFYQHLPLASTTQRTPNSLLQTWKSQKESMLASLLNLSSKNQKKHEGFAIPSMVNYVGFGGTLLQPGEHVHGATSVATRYLSTGYMWDHVRVLGGAYGGFARFSESTGRFVYLSYRDPNLSETLSVYNHAGEHLLSEAEISSEDILQAVIASIGDLDSPMSPDQQGFASFSRYLAGISLADRQQYRDELLQTTIKDFHALAEKLKGLRETGEIVVFGSQQALDAANQVLEEGAKLHIEPAFGTGEQSPNN